MPTGPKGEKRPADVIGNAVKVMRILTGEEPKDFGNVIAAIPVPGENPFTQSTPIWREWP